MKTRTYVIVKMPGETECAHVSGGWDGRRWRAYHATALSMIIDRPLKRPAKGFVGATYVPAQIVSRKVEALVALCAPIPG